MCNIYHKNEIILLTVIKSHQKLEFRIKFALIRTFNVGELLVQIVGV